MYKTNLGDIFIELKKKKKSCHYQLYHQPITSRVTFSRTQTPALSLFHLVASTVGSGSPLLVRDWELDKVRDLSLSLSL